MMSHRPRNRDAAALIFVLGVLFVLASLAIAFARSMSVERDAAKSRSDEVQAKFAAWAGWEHAWTQVRQDSRKPFDGPGEVTWFYRGLTGRDTGNGIPIDQATAPSFKLGTGPSGLAYSGVVGETYEEDGDTYALKVLDAASMININLPLDSRRTDTDQSLVRLLNSLSQAIADSEPYRTWFPGDTLGPLYDENGESIALYIISYRRTLTGQKYSSKQQILEIPGLVISAKKFGYLRDFLTVHSYEDPTEIAPLDPAYRPGEGTLVDGRIPTGSPVHQSRSPININTAPAEVLTAIFAGIRGFWINRVVDRSIVGSSQWNAVGLTRYTDAVTLAEAKSLADDIVTRRETDAYEDWEEFRNWLQGTTVLDEMQEAAVLANCDPNVNTHRANPDEILWREIDKFDVFDSTTELCFNSCGVFEIESLGRVTHDGGVIRSQAVITSVVQLFSIYRETTQNQFNSGRIRTRTVRTPLVGRLTQAIMSEGDLTVNGTVDFTGAAGGVHTNQNLQIIGQPSFSGDATASGTYTSSSGNETVGGAQGGGYDLIPIPTLTPSDFKPDADYVYGADGTIKDRNGNVVGTNSYGPFELKNGEWDWNGDVTDGTYYFEGDVKVSGNTGGATWHVTIIATGHISITGAPLLAPDQASGLTCLAGTDFKMHGTPQGGTTGTLSGIFYAGEQSSISGTTNIDGVIIAKETGNSDSFVSSTDASGTIGVNYDGGYTIVYGYEEHQVENLTRYPDPNAIGQVGGQDVNLAAFNDYDGYIGLAPMNTSKSYLGGDPPADALLANWEGNEGLHADAAGGQKSIQNDVSGPSITPVCGETTVGNLLRDGYYSEREAVGAYLAPDNIGATQGTIQFWFKPSWNATLDGTVMTRSNKSHNLVGLTRTDGAGGDQKFNFFQTGDHPTWGNWTTFHFERTAATARASDRKIYSSWFPPAHLWTHFALVYDFTQPNYLDGIALYVNGALVTGAIYDGLANFTLDPTETSQAAITTGNSIRIGERGSVVLDIPAVGADGTYDGFMTLGSAKDANWAQVLYNEGRYYSGGDAVYTSRDLPIPIGSDILHATWTLRYPSGWTGAPVRIEIVSSQGGTETVVKQAINGQGVIGSIDDVNSAIFYRLVFQDPGAQPNAPYFTSPIVDDVTIAYAQEPVILLWEE